MACFELRCIWSAKARCLNEFKQLFRRSRHAASHSRIGRPNRGHSAIRRAGLKKARIAEPFTNRSTARTSSANFSAGAASSRYTVPMPIKSTPYPNVVPAKPDTCLDFCGSLAMPCEPKPAKAAHMNISFYCAVCNNSTRSNNAGPPIAVGAIPVSVKSPKSAQRSRVCSVHFDGALGETCVAFQPVVFWPAK